MEQFLNGTVKPIIDFINDNVLGYLLVVLLICVGLFYSIKTKFVQVRFFKQGMKKVFGGFTLSGKKQKSGMSSFQAFTTAVAAQVGTGNIVGACGAILVGGPGAIFWMWIIAFFGMSTIYAEAVLAQKSRVVGEDGNVQGGPVYYIKKAFKGGFGKFLAGFFAVAIIIALGFIGSMVQSNSITVAVMGAVSDIPDWFRYVIGGVIALFAGFIFIGGVKRIASATEKIVPIMAILYLVGGLIILCARITVVPEAIWLIFKYAFTPSAIIGGGVGAIFKTIIKGAQRGLFSNEAGMGSTPHAHAQANVETAHEQGVTAMIGVFLDTFVVLTMTALVVISTLYAGNGIVSQVSVGVADADAVKNAIAGAGVTDGNAVKTAIATVFNGSNVGLTIGGFFVAICLLFFAFSTIISWNLFGKINFIYLFGKKSSVVYSILSISFIFIGAVLANQPALVWACSDLFNNLMVIPNVMALLMLSKVVVGELKENGKKSFDKTPNETLSENISK